jgi:hypothetical protein
VAGRGVAWLLAAGVVYPVGPGLPLPRVPPLEAVLPPGTETVYRGHLTSRERVLVGVEPSGKVRRIRVQQRLTVGGVGDYAFTVPGAFADVQPLPGSASDPGLRSSGIVWAGFSPGRRLLAAEAVLVPGGGTRYLPLQVRLQRRGGGLRLIVRNATRVAAQVQSGDADPAQLAAALDGARGALRQGRTPAAPVPVSGAIASHTVQVPARLSVTVRIGRQTPQTRDLGPGGSLTETLPVPSSRTPVTVEARPVVSGDPLRPPGGAASWRAVVDRLGPAATLRLAGRLALLDARTRQFQTFLANPDPRGQSTATYRYTVVPAAQVTSRPAPGKDDGHRTAVILALALLAVAAVGLAVAWAHA